MFQFPGTILQRFWSFAQKSMMPKSKEVHTSSYMKVLNRSAQHRAENNFIDAPLPPWAEHEINGELMPMAQLLTRDGRRCGNAILMESISKDYLNEDFTIMVYICVTDAGTILRLTKNEIDEIFYPTKYIVKDFLIGIQQSAVLEYCDGLELEKYYGTKKSSAYAALLCRRSE